MNVIFDTEEQTVWTSFTDGSSPVWPKAKAFERVYQLTCKQEVNVYTTDDTRWLLPMPVPVPETPKTSCDASPANDLLIIFDCRGGHAQQAQHRVVLASQVVSNSDL